MRTTVELDPALMRAAKARSAERGESLKSLLARAVAAELNTVPVRTSSTRVVLPLFGNPAGSRVRLSSADVEQALADADSASLRARTRRRRT